MINASLSTTAATASTINFASIGTIAVSNNIVVGGGFSTSAGVINQTSGTVNANTGSSTYLSLGDNTNAYGAYNISGGTLNSETIRDGGFNAGGTASNGSSLFAVTGSGIVNQGTNNMIVGRAGAGTNLLYINGSTASFTNGNFVYDGYTGSSNDTVTLNAGALTTTAFAFNGATNFTGTAILNLDGGTLKTGSITSSNTGSTGIVNFNGGTLQAGAATTTFNPTNVVSANVYAGGAKIDTLTNTITMSQPLVTTANTTGVATIPVATNGGGSGYLSAPLVSITGGGGTGATAVANLTNGVVTSITITSPGTGYGGITAPTVSLIGGGATTAATLGTLTTASNGTTDGGLTKLGTGTLTLTGASTYRSGH